MGREEQIKYWISTSNEDWGVVQDLHKSGRHMYALFFIHLTMEKLLEGHWVKSNSEAPPRTHDLIHIHDQTELNLASSDLELLESLNSWNLEGRYPDYKKSLYKMATAEFTASKIEKVEILRKWLLEKLQ